MCCRETVAANRLSMHCTTMRQYHNHVWRVVQVLLDRCDRLKSVSKAPQPSEKHMEVARRVVQQGESFRSAAVAVGFSEAYANQGPKGISKRAPALGIAFNKAQLEVVWTPEDRKRLAVHRIVKTCADDKNSDNLRAAELIGRMKDVDLFVRNGEAQVGVFFGMIEGNIDALAEPIDIPAVESQDIEPK